MKVIGIAAGKGGVGKSTVAVHLGLALRNLGFSVGIIDADVYGPSIHGMIKIRELPKEDQGLILPAIGMENLSYISIAFFRSEDEANALRAPIANDIIMQFIDKVQWDGCDYLLIDFPPGTGDIPLTLVQKKTMTIILVTIPGKISLIDVRKASHMFRQMNTEVLGIVENMSYLKIDEKSEKFWPFGPSTGQQFADEQGLNFLGQIPMDREIVTSIQQEISPYKMDPRPAFTDHFMRLAEQIEKAKTQWQIPLNVQLQVDTKDESSGSCHEN